jgi:hypothetical protein
MRYVHTNTLSCVSGVVNTNGQSCEVCPELLTLTAGAVRHVRFC